MEHSKAETHQKNKNKSRPVSEARKIRKPLMERKRRERINTSLNELARLLVEAKKVDGDAGKVSKLEKADILELTVNHLQSIHSNCGSSNKGEPLSLEEEEKFSQGFSECIKVVERILKRSTTESLREKLLNHLNSKLKVMKSSKKSSASKEPSQTSDKEQCTTIASESKTGFVGDISMENLTLVPTEMPGGEVAFILKGDTKKLLKEWASFPNGNKFSSFNENEILPKELDSKCRLNTFPAKETSSTPASSFQPVNECFQQSLSRMEIDSVNPSCESKNNLRISMQSPSSSPLNISSDSIPEYHSPSLSKNTILAANDKDYCYRYPTMSPVPTESLKDFSLDGQTSCLSDAYYSGNGSYVVSTYATQTHHANTNSSQLIPSISHASINHFNQNQNSCNHVSDLNRNSSGLSSSGNSQQRLPHKAHCPPTPPPSPPSGAEHRKSSKACLIDPENRFMHEAEIDIDQPFDLSMNKMWRPW